MTARSGATSRPAFAFRQRAAAALFALLAIGLLISVVPAGVARIGTTFPGFLVWDNGVLVALHRADWTGARSGLPLNGGILTEVEGQAFRGGRALIDAVEKLEPGSAVRYGVRIGDAVQVHEVATMRYTTADYVFTSGVYLLNALALFGVGALALLLRPELTGARALALSTGVLGALLILAIDYVSTYAFVSACRTAEALAPAALANLALVFPRERIRARPRHVLLMGLAAVPLGAQLWTGLYYESRPELARGVAVGIYAAIGLLLLALVVNYAETFWRASDSKLRQQAAVVFAGGLPAFTLAGAGMLAYTALGFTYSWTWVFALLPLAPISMLYAMVRLDLLAAERLARLTVGYTIATGTVLGGYALALAGVSWLLVSEPRLDSAGALVLIVGAALGFEPLRRRVQQTVDRAFFRSRLDAAAELERAVGDLAALTDTHSIRAYVSNRLERALALDWAAFTTDGEPGRDDPALIRDVHFQGERLGSVVCGPKSSRAPFSREERDFVDGMAAQAALALHNARAMDALREAQETLRVRERLAAVGEFAASMAHGIRNPLTAISIAVQMARSQAQGGPLEDSLERAGDAAKRLEERIRSLLDYASASELRIRSADLGGVLHEVERTIKPYAERMKVKLHVELPLSPVRWDVDSALLEQALLELATNALRSMKEGGRLRMQLTGDDAAASIYVEDTGPGIPPEVRDRIFDLFFTTRRDGSGIGLANVRKIMDMHKGRVEIVRSDSGGTIFALRFV